MKFYGNTKFILDFEDKTNKLIKENEKDHQMVLVKKYLLMEYRLKK